MTEERTVSDTDVVDIESKMTLDKHNPLGAVGSDITEELVKITDISIPSVRRILNSSEPSINITAETQASSEIDLELVLDEFSDKVEEKMSLRSFCSSIGIEKQDLYNLINEKVPLRISRTNGEFDTNLPKESGDVNITSETDTSWRFERLCDLWKAKEYGKARIVSVDEQSNRGFVCVLEIPWLNEKKKLRFSTSKRWDSTYPSFPSFYKNLVGRYPVNKEELSSIVGEEIPLNYEGRFDLAENMKEDIEDENDSFFEYVKNNSHQYTNRLTRDILSLGTHYISPAFVIILVLTSLAFLPMSTVLGWLTLGLFVFSPIIIASTVEAYTRYNSREPISKK